MIKTAEDIINDNKRDPVWIRGDKSVYQAIRLMVEQGIGAILVKKADRFVGIFSERDLLRNSAAPDFNPRTALVSDYMSSPLHCVPHDMQMINLMEKFLGLFIRHLLVERGARQIGLLSIGDVMRASLLEQDRRIRELHEIASWDYYEDWGWDKKRPKK